MFKKKLHYNPPKSEIKNIQKRKTIFLQHRQMERVNTARESMTSRIVSSLSLPFLDVTAASNPLSRPPSWMIYGVGLEGRPSGHHSKLGGVEDLQVGWPKPQTQPNTINVCPLCY
jgi:hypothetical protein